MTRRRWVFLVPVVVLAAAVAAGIVLTRSEPLSRLTGQGQLAYSVAATGQGLIEAKLSDDRDGKHTSWLILHDAPRDGDDRLVNLFRDSDFAGVGSTSAERRLPAGVYRYGVYSTNRLYAPDDPKFWTARYLVAEGEVTVP